MAETMLSDQELRLRFWRLNPKDIPSYAYCRRSPIDPEKIPSDIRSRKNLIKAYEVGEIDPYKPLYRRPIADFLFKHFNIKIGNLTSTKLRV